MNEWSALARQLQEEYHGHVSETTVVFQVTEFRRRLAKAGDNAEEVPDYAWTELRRALDELSAINGQPVLRLADRDGRTRRPAATG